MNKKLFLVILFFFPLINYGSGTVHCPSANDWEIHVKGNPWILKDSARDFGWRVDDSGADDWGSESMPNNTSLTVDIRTNFGRWNFLYPRKPVACIYRNDSYTITIINQNKNPNIQTISRPPFVLNENTTAFNNLKCDTNAATPENCTWEWE